MTDIRKMLVKLLVEAQKKCEVCDCVEDDRCPYEETDGCLDVLIADHLIANGVTVQKWIPVTERLPIPGERVIVCRGDKVEQGAFLGVNGWWKVYGTNTKKITHWMPLPEAPKKVAADA